MNLITTYVKIAEINGFKIADCAGFGDNIEDKVFLQSYRDNESVLKSMAPINAIVMVVKFNNTDALSFKNTAYEFWKIFGNRSIGSIVLLCIQTGDIIYSDDDFRRILTNSEGYKFLKSKNEDRDIPHVLWDNFHEYPNQTESFNNENIK